MVALGLLDLGSACSECLPVHLVFRSVAEATETRKAENAEYTTVKAQNNAAVQLLGVAENRLNKSGFRDASALLEEYGYRDCTGLLRGSRSAGSLVL